MAGYIGSKSSVTQVDGYNRTEADAEFVAKAGGTMTGAVTIDADGATALTVDRATSDGTIIDVQKGGTTVGSIGSSASGQYLHIGSDDVGLTFAPNVDSIIPFNVGTGAYNANVDLGYSAGTKFRNIYLNSGVYVDTGGGVYLGGTGAANKLDDYEEGTWTPTNVTYDTLYYAKYVKIGSVVIAALEMQGNITLTSNSISGLPFSGHTTAGQPSHYMQGFAVGSGNIPAHTVANTTIFFRVQNQSTGANSNLSDLTGQYISLLVTYITTA